MNSVHEPVLLHEVVEHLVVGSRLLVNGKSQEANTNNQKLITNNQFPWLLDGTLGGASHALAIAKAVNGRLNIIGLDRDVQAIERAAVTLQGKAKKVILAKENFRNLDKVLDRHGITGLDLILLDLGISSDELENSGRGFTFQKDEPLLMTMGDPKDYPFTAQDIVNDWDEEVIANIIFGYGEERFARRISRKIIQYRLKKKIETSAELAEIVVQAIPFVARRNWRKATNDQKSGTSTSYQRHPATKTFQAIRIAVNDELNALKDGLLKGYERLNQGGRMAIISFHSLEDRLVKDFNKKNGGIIITKKPITPSDQEVAENPRSRSAKLRVIEKR